jgi:hypothetical protein
LSPQIFGPTLPGATIYHWPACSPVCCLHYAIFLPLFCCTTYWFTLKIKAAGFSEMLVTFYQTRWRHIPEDSNIHIHCSMNLTFHEIWTFHEFKCSEIMFHQCPTFLNKNCYKQ